MGSYQDQRASVKSALMDTLGHLGGIVADGQASASDRVRAADAQRRIAEFVDAQAGRDARERSRAEGFQWAD